MQNPMMNQLNTGRINSIKNMFDAIKSAGNPQAMFGQMMMQNPQFKQVVDYVNANGGDARSAFYAMAKEKGVDPEQILSIFRR